MKRSVAAIGDRDVADVLVGLLQLDLIKGRAGCGCEGERGGGWCGQLRGACGWRWWLSLLSWYW